MIAYLLRRLVHTAILSFIIVTVVFMMIHLLPGDPATMILGGEDAQPTQEDIDRVKTELGLDQPVYRQYVTWLGKISRLDFGVSFRNNEPVASTVLLKRLPRSLMLGIPATLLAIAIGVPLGILGARLRRTMWDPIISAVALLGFSVPTFVIGTLLILLFAVRLGWLPAGSFVHPLDDMNGFLKAAALPIVSLALSPLAVIMRMTRSSVLEELGSDYVRTARAKGLAEAPVIVRHVMRNSMLPVITVMGLQFGGLFAGSVIIEFIFNWPGMGRLFLTAIGQRDYPVIQAVVLVVALSFVLINLLTDLSYAFFDPRIRVDRN
ncbi:MAG TPA: ABC transporter permease [Thermomicrobiales bacterium]|nr:ABC transporter permease [Thermomicrobiales bacterium]